MMRLTVIFGAFLFCGPAVAGHPNAAMYHAALKGDLCGVAKSISKGGVVNQQYPFSKGRTPLMAAIISGDWNTVNFLLRFRSDPAIKNNDKESKEFGWNALDYAVNYKHNDRTTEKEKAVGVSILHLIESKMGKASTSRY